MRDLGYIALIVLLLFVVKSDYDIYAEANYNLLSPPITLHHSSNFLWRYSVTLEDKRGYRFTLSGISALSNRIGQEYEEGDIVTIKQTNNFHKKKINK